MITVASGEWIADLGNLTCWNINKNIIVEFQKSGKTYIGKIRDMPVELFAQYAELQHGERLIKKAITEAEEVFLRAYAQREIENGAGLNMF